MAWKRPLVVAIAGGSGSGKTTVARALAAALPSDQAVLIEQDCYYRDLRHLSYEERTKVNFDHPDSLEMPLLLEHLDALLAGKAIDKPRYDFGEHVRATESDHLEARPVVLVEGILLLADPRLRERVRLKLFVDTDDDIRLMRRIRRDLETRSRTFAQVRRQYYETVRPMHLRFVEPSKRFANVIIPEGGENSVALDVIIGSIRDFLRRYNEESAPPAALSAG